MAFFLFLTSPFAINYATTARMYSLMILLSLLGYLALSRAFENPTARPAGGCRGGHRGAALHPLLGSVPGASWSRPGWLVEDLGQRPRLAGAQGHDRRGPVCGSRGRRSSSSRPCIPVRPWTTAASAGDLLGVFSDWSGGGPWGGLLMLATFALFLFGVFGRTAAPGTIVTIEDPDGYVRRVQAGPAVVLELRPRPGMAPAGRDRSGHALSGRDPRCRRQRRLRGPLYRGRAPAVPAGRGDRRGHHARTSFPGRVHGGPRAWPGCSPGYGENRQQRTQAVQVAAVLNAQAQAGDVVVYCPDQLGPAVDRLLRVPRRRRDHLSHGPSARSGSTGSTTRRSSPARTSSRSPSRPWPGSSRATPCGWCGATAIPAWAGTAAT